MLDMNPLSKVSKSICIVLSAVILFSSCSSTTVIHSSPGEAKVYLNEEYKGTTPITYTDTKIITTTNYVRLEKEGYDTFRTTFTRDEKPHAGAIIAGIFFLIPLLWCVGYNDSRTYEMTKTDHSKKEENSTSTTKKESGQTLSEQLRDLKELKDEGILTEEEFEKEKKKILDAR